MGLSPEIKTKGYALLCVSYAKSSLELETQDEDEVYEQQFGRYFAKGKVRFGLPLDEE
jgi:ferredoxin